MGGYSCAFSAIDLATGFKWGCPLKHQAHLKTTLVELRLEIVSESRKLKNINN